MSEITILIDSTYEMKDILNKLGCYWSKHASKWLVNEYISYENLLELLYLQNKNSICFLPRMDNMPFKENEIIRNHRVNMIQWGKHYITLRDAIKNFKMIELLGYGEHLTDDFNQFQEMEICNGRRLPKNIMNIIGHYSKFCDVKKKKEKKIEEKKINNNIITNKNENKNQMAFAGYQRIYINVDYENKEEAKSLGCGWDPEAKSWFYNKPHLPKIRNGFYEKEKMILQKFPKKN